MSSREFGDWLGLEELAPRGDRLQILLNAWLIFNVKSMFSSDVKFEDCILDFDRTDVRKEDQEKLGKSNKAAMTMLLGTGKVKRPSPVSKIG